MSEITTWQSTNYYIWWSILYNLLVIKEKFQENSDEIALEKIWIILRQSINLFDRLNQQEYQGVIEVKFSSREEYLCIIKC